MAQDDSVIVKKVKKGGHAAHHGGAWKVAYADFVTAMMAFFLLLWLLNATTEDQRQGLADYFSPTPGAIQSTTGGEGMMSGQSVATEGAQSRPKNVTLSPQPCAQPRSGQTHGRSPVDQWQ